MASADKQVIEWELTQIIYRFCHCLDNDRNEGVLELFAEDAEWDRAGNIVTGREAILHTLENRPNRVTRHLVVNTLFNMTEESSAQATMCVLGYVGKPEMRDLPVLFGMSDPLIVEFDSHFINTSDGWKIARLAVRKVMVGE